MKSSILAVWRLPPTKRGELIEIRLGHNLPKSFPVIDMYTPLNNGVTSMKSVDLTANTYQTPGKLFRILVTYIDKLASFNGAKHGGVEITADDAQHRTLDLAVPHMGSATQSEELTRATEYAIKQGITMRIIIC